MQNPARKITIKEGAAHWARISGAPRPHRATLIRWAIKGCRGQRLQAETLGGRWYTTTDAIETFLRYVSRTSDDAAEGFTGPARAAQVQRALDDLDQIIKRKPHGYRPDAR